MYASPPSGWYEEPEYYIYSSVTGQKLVELDQSGQWKKKNVYLGSTVIAEHTSGGTAFKHTDPMTGSTMQTDPAGEIEAYDVGRVELNALGDVLATQPPEIQEPPHNFGKGGSTSNPESGCTWDGAPIRCSMISSITRRGAHELQVNERAEGGWALYRSLQSQVSTWRFNVYKASVPFKVVFDGDMPYRVPAGPATISYLGSFYASFLSSFSETIVSRLNGDSRQVEDRKDENIGFRRTNRKARYSDKRFAECLKLFGVTPIERDVIVDNEPLHLTDGLVFGRDSRGWFASFLGTRDRDGHRLSVTVDGWSKTINQLDALGKTPVRSLYAGTVYIGSDIGSWIGALATAIHEIGNGLSRDPSHPQPQAIDRLLREADLDSGNALEECVFGGRVGADGYLQTPYRKRHR